MDYPIRAESGKGRSAHIFNLNERAVGRRQKGGEIALRGGKLCVNLQVELLMMT